MARGLDLAVPACGYPTLEKGFQIFKELEKTKDM